VIYAAVSGPLASREDIAFWLSQMTAANVHYRRQARGRGRPYPPLYASGVRYQRELGRGQMSRPEQWQTVPVLYETGWGDCEDLACALAAEMQVEGVHARPELLHVAPGLWHIVVRLPSGELEDPSARLGMPPSQVAGICCLDEVGAGRPGLRRFTRGLRAFERVLPLRQLAADAIRTAASSTLGSRAGDALGETTERLLRIAEDANGEADTLERDAHDYDGHASPFHEAS